MYLGKALCDKHADLVQSDNARVATRYRNKLGLPPIETYVPPPEPEQPAPQTRTDEEYNLEDFVFDWTDEE
jgi:hypothetical protein